MADGTLPASKVCTKCGEAKPTAEYYRATSGSVDGFRAQCRACCNAVRRAGQTAERREKSTACLREARIRHPERYREYDRRNHEKNKGAGSEYEKRRYAKRDKAAARESLTKWKSDNPVKARAIEVSRNERVKKQALTDPEFREKLNKKSREWATNKRNTDAAFREKKNAATRKWHDENKDRQNAYKRKVNAERRKTDVMFKIKSALRSRLRIALMGGRTGSAVRMLGCSIEHLRSHIEASFQDDMTWDNWGRGWGGALEWQIDHIRPLASFDLTDPEQLADACHYTNLQPLWASDNRSKGARLWQEPPL